MSTFDDRFADRVREAFDAYEEPIDEQAWAQVQARLRAEAGAQRNIWPLYLLRAAAVVLVAVAVYGMWPDAAPDASRPELATLAPYGGMEEVVIPHAEPTALVQTARRARPAPLAMVLSREMEVEHTAEQDAPPHVLPDAHTTLEQIPPSVVVRAEPTPGRVPEPVDPSGPTRPSSGFHVWAGSMATVADQRLAEGASLTLGVGHTWALAERVHLTTGGAVTYQNIAYVPDVPPAEVFTTTVSQSGQTLTARLEERREVTTWAVEFPVLFGIDLVRTPDRVFRVQGGVVSVAYAAQRFLEEGTRITGEPRVNIASGQTEVVFTQTAFQDRERAAPFSRAEVGGFLHLGMGAEVKPSGLGLDVFYRRSLRGTTQREVQLSGIGVGLRVSL